MEKQVEKLTLEQENEYTLHRIALFDKLKAEYDSIVHPEEPITVSLPTSQVQAISFKTTPLDIAKNISSSLAKRILISKVNGVLWDLLRPLESNCSLELLDFDHKDAKMVFWHSSAHVLGEACERHYACHLCIGPPIENGYYYEMGMDRAISQSDYPALNSLSKKICSEKQKFERLVMSKSDLLEMFKHNRFKVHIIQDKIPDGTFTTVYRCGPLIDLCYGPHIPDTGRIKSMMITKNSASYFLGDSKNESLQRIYGVSFPDQKLMDEHVKFLAEAALRDHRKIGQDQELFFFNELSPGSCFFLPHGTRIYNSLVALQREEYVKRGFQEVITPNMYNTKLWETSGHWQNYQENMFSFEIEKEKFALKPMNCPGHCVMFKHRDRSYRELPLRMADFGVLHRNEFSGALTGLTRVRRFQQDDAHIFCTVDQIGDEMTGCLDFLRHIYGIFGFEFSLELSTRPEKYLGDLKTWDKAESILEKSLNEFGHPWVINPADGAFYGPKIDITISDALKRKFQCATIQLDFQLPERFELQYSTNDPNEALKRPVMIHRAILGSVERMLAILTEHTAGKWPFWLSPRQVIVIPVAVAYYEYATSIKEKICSEGMFCEADLSGETLSKKIRNAQISMFNFILVVGQDEMESASVNVRNRDFGEKHRGDVKSLDLVLDAFKGFVKSRSLTQQFSFFMFIFLFTLISSIFAANLTGKITPSDIPNLTKIRIQLGPNITFPSQSGTFKFKNISQGTYTLIILDINYMWNRYRIDVNSSDQIIISETIFGYNYDRMGPIINSLKISPRYKVEYDIKPAGFSVLSLFSNPMILMMGVMMLMLLVMPRLMAGMDPEDIKEMQKNQPKIQTSLPDVSEKLASWLTK